MIEGVKIKRLKLIPDDRGYLVELVKFGEETFIKIKQTTFTLTYPGIIKAFHYHKNQTDVWFVASGMIQVVLYDLRKESNTYQVKDVIFMGEQNPILVLIPPLVAHGYKVLGQKPALLFYHTDQAYNPENPDEYRISYNDPKIGFDWSVKFR